MTHSSTAFIQHILAWREALEIAGIPLAVWRIHRRIGMSGGLSCSPPRDIVSPSPKAVELMNLSEAHLTQGRTEPKHYIEPASAIEETSDHAAEAFSHPPVHAEPELPKDDPAAEVPVQVETQAESERQGAERATELREAAQITTPIFCLYREQRSRKDWNYGASFSAALIIII